MLGAEQAILGPIIIKGFLGGGGSFGHFIKPKIFLGYLVQSLVCVLITKIYTNDNEKSLCHFRTVMEVLYLKNS